MDKYSKRANNKKIPSYIELRKVDLLIQSTKRELRWLQSEVKELNNKDYWETYNEDYILSGYESEGLFSMNWESPKFRKKRKILEINKLHSKLKELKGDYQKRMRIHQIACEEQHKLNK